jgi:uncharacterized protein YegP (UPF0339 family)
MFEWQVIYSRSKRQWYFRFRTSNNRILCHSEYYQNRDDAVGAIKLIQRNGPLAPIKDYAIA